MHCAFNQSTKDKSKELARGEKVNGRIFSNTVNFSSSISAFSVTRKSSQGTCMSMKPAVIYFMLKKAIFKAQSPKPVYKTVYHWSGRVLRHDGTMFLPYLPSPACLCGDNTNSSPTTRWVILHPGGTQPGPPARAGRAVALTLSWKTKVTSSPGAFCWQYKAFIAAREGARQPHRARRGTYEGNKLPGALCF